MEGKSRRAIFLFRPDQAETAILLHGAQQYVNGQGMIHCFRQSGS